MTIDQIIYLLEGALAGFAVFVIIHALSKLGGKDNTPYDHEIVDFPKDIKNGDVIFSTKDNKYFQRVQNKFPTKLDEMDFMPLLEREKDIRIKRLISIGNAFPTKLHNDSEIQEDIDGKTFRVSTMGTKAIENFDELFPKKSAKKATKRGRPVGSTDSKLRKNASAKKRIEAKRQYAREYYQKNKVNKK